MDILCEQDEDSHLTPSKAMAKLRTLASTSKKYLNEKMQVGIDEAGRGPVFGPMVYAGMAWPASLSTLFTAVGFKDSKQLSEGKREELYASIQELQTLGLLVYEAEVCSPLHISSSQQAFDEVNLNTYSHNCAIKIINSFLQRGLKIRCVYLDTVGDPDKYQTMLSEIFNKSAPSTKFVVSKKADDLYPVVSAASVVAKVTRDRAVKSTHPVEKIKVSKVYGSGYPADPITVQWLDNHLDKFFGYPSVVRFSWSTIQRRLADNNIKYCFYKIVPQHVQKMMDRMKKLEEKGKGAKGKGKGEKQHKRVDIMQDKQVDEQAELHTLEREMQDELNPTLQTRRGPFADITYYNPTFTL